MICDGASRCPPDARVGSLSQPGQGSIKMQCTVGLPHDVGVERDAQHVKGGDKPGHRTAGAVPSGAE